MAEQDPGEHQPPPANGGIRRWGCGHLSLHDPLDVVKVRLQSQRPSVASELMPPSRLWSLSYAKWKCFLYCNGVLEPLYLCPNGTRCATWFQDPTRFTGTVDAFVKIVRHEGTRTVEWPPSHPGDDCASHCRLLHRLRPTQGLPVWASPDL